MHSRINRLNSLFTIAIVALLYFLVDGHGGKKRTFCRKEGYCMQTSESRDALFSKMIRMTTARLGGTQHQTYYCNVKPKDAYIVKYIDDDDCNRGLRCHNECKKCPENAEGDSSNVYACRCKVGFKRINLGTGGLNVLWYFKCEKCPLGQTSDGIKCLGQTVEEKINSQIFHSPESEDVNMCQLFHPYGQLMTSFHTKFEELFNARDAKNVLVPQESPTASFLQLQIPLKKIGKS
eukprot:g14876.t1